MQLNIQMLYYEVVQLKFMLLTNITEINLIKKITTHLCQYHRSQYKCYEKTWNRERQNRGRHHSNIQISK